MPQTSFCYFVILFYDHSRVTWLYLMKKCSKLLSHVRAFQVEIRTQFNVSLKTLCTDHNVGRYFSHVLGCYLGDYDILHQSSIPKWSCLKKK